MDGQSPGVPLVILVGHLENVRLWHQADLRRQQLTRSGHLERGAELARVSRPSLPLHGQNLPAVDRQKIAVLIGYHNGETGVTALAVRRDWSTFDV
jgi:hypothetical protein